MIRAGRYGVLALLVMAAPAALCRGETFEEVEKKLTDAAKAVKSVQMKMQMDMKMSQPGFEMTQVMTGTYVHMRDGEKVKSRMEGEAKSVQKMGDTENTQNTKTVVVSDGETLYTLNEAGGNKTVYKSKAPDMDEMPWAAAKEDNDFKVLPDEKIDGADCYVIESAAKTKETGDQSHTVFYCRKDCGMPVKMLVYDAEGKVMTTMTYTDVKLNGSVSADLFKFEVPEGAQVTDLSGNG